MKIATLLSPLELPALASRDLRETICVVFDILRATSTFVTALQNGAKEIIPVSEISEAVALKNSRSVIRDSQLILLAGERDGWKISAAPSGGVDFDLGNSPREFLPEIVRGRTIVSTTTNGTRALRACVGAKTILAASFLNLSATAEFLRAQSAENLLLVCAGTGENMASEDILAAGALEGLLTLNSENFVAAEVRAESRPQGAKNDLLAALADSQNGRRLLAIPALRDDVAFCAQRDIFDLVAMMDNNGILRRI